MKSYLLGMSYLTLAVLITPIGRLDAAVVYEYTGNNYDGVWTTPSIYDIYRHPAPAESLDINIFESNRVILSSPVTGPH